MPSLNKKFLDFKKIMCIIISINNQIKLMKIKDSKDLIDLLKKDGWFLINTVGSHCQFKHDIKKGRETIPHPKKDLPIGTVKSILKQALITIEDM